jgi:hypothetical protein
MTPPHPLELLYSTEPPGRRALKLVFVYVTLAAIAWLIAHA